VNEKAKKAKVPTKKSKDIEAPVEKKVRSSISKDAGASKPSKKTKKVA
jgi:hypothetical protein